MPNQSLLSWQNHLWTLGALAVYLTWRVWDEVLLNSIFFSCYYSIMISYLATMYILYFSPVPINQLFVIWQINFWMNQMIKYFAFCILCLSLFFFMFFPDVNQNNFIHSSENSVIPNMYNVAFYALTQT